MPLAVAVQAAKPHSRFVAACTDKTLRMFGPAGNALGTLTGHTDWVYAVAASGDGSLIASGSGDGTVKLWGPAGKLLRTLTVEPKP